MTARYFTNSIVRRDQESYAKKLKMPAGSMAELKRAYLDVNFFNLPEIRALMRKFKRSAGLALVQIYLAMSAAEGGRIDEDALCAILEDNEIKSPEAFISYCIDKSLIKLFREKISDSSEINPAFPGNETRLPDSDYDNEYEDQELIIALPEFRDVKIAAAILRWREYRRASFGKSFDQMALDSLISLYAGRANELPDDIDHSISNGWKTLNAKNRPRAGPAQKSTRDTLNEMMAEENRRIANEQV